MKFFGSREVRIVFLVLALAAGLTPPAATAADTGALDYFTLPDSLPCRVYDSRPDLLLAGASRTVTITGGSCDIPSEAVAVALNLTVLDPTASGDLSLYPTGVAVGAGSPAVAALSLKNGVNRAMMLLIELGASGDLEATNNSAGTLHFLIDVSGYFVNAAFDDTAIVMEDALATTIDVLANDTGGASNTIIDPVTSQPANGTVVITNSGADLTYEPDADYCNDPPGTATDNFTYTLTGGSQATVAVTVTCINDAPTNIALSDTQVSEGQPIGTVVGTFSTTDVDLPGDSHTYSFVTDPQGPDNGSFQISGNQLLTNEVFDLETKSSYTIYVRTTDSGTLTFDKQFTITITDGNDAPTDIALSPADVDENQPAGTTVGTFSTTDQDVGDTFTYTLVGGAGSTDNGSFTIAGNLLQTGAMFDAEVKNSYSIRVRSTDSGSLFFEKVFTITVNSVPEAPTDIALSPTSVNENQPSGTTVGTFSTTDQDVGDTFTYTLVGGAGSTDNGSFTIAGNLLQTGAMFDAEVKNSYSIRVRSTDSGSLFFEKVFTITVNSVPEAPTDIALSPTSVNENQPSGTTVGTFSTTDQDVGDTFTYTLVGGAGSTDNGSFTIAGNLLKTGAIFNYEVKNSYSIRVRSTDSGSLFTEKVFTITVVDIPEPPVAQTDDYDTVANTRLEVRNVPSATGPKIVVIGDVMDNDSDQDAGSTLSVVPASGTTTKGGSFSILMDGTFTYEPEAGDIHGAGTEDTFTYTLTDGTFNVPGTVRIKTAGRVWYVKNDAPALGTGRSNDPFDMLAEAEPVSAAGDYIFVYGGDLTTTGQASGIVLKANQKLYGEAHGLTVTATVNGVVNPNLVAATVANRPKIDNTSAGGNAVGITNIAGVEVRGLSIAANTNAVNVTTTAAGTGGATITDNVITGSGQQGIKVAAGGTGGTTVTVQSNTISATGNGIEARTSSAGMATITASTNMITSTGGNAFDARTLAGAGALRVAFDSSNVAAAGNGIVIDGSAAGTTTITNFLNNVVDGSTVGTGISVTSAIFDATPGGLFNTVSGGATVIGGAGGNGVGQSGLVLTNVQGDLNFGNLNIFADNGAGLQASSGAAYTGSAGLRIVVGAGVGIIEATGGPAVNINTATIDLQLSSLKSTSTSSTGVSLVSVSDGGATNAVFSAGSGSITTTAGASGPAFNVSGGNAKITFGGTITNNGTGRAVSITSWSGDDAVPGDDLLLSGAIDENGAGILLNGNGGSRSITFNGGMDIDTTTGEGFAATTNTNTGGLHITGTNTIDTTIATALRVTSTPIGNSGLTFRSISSGTAGSDSSAVGIVLDNTGTAAGNGGLTVTGTGSANSGGTIQRKTGGDGSTTAGIGIYLNNTKNPSLSWMLLRDFQNYAIRGIGVSGFTLANSTVEVAAYSSNGTSAASDEGSISFGSRAPSSQTGLTGTASITNSTIRRGFEDSISVFNWSGVLDLTIDNCVIRDTTGNDGVVIEAHSNADIGVDLKNSDLISNVGDHFQATADDTAILDVKFGTNGGNTLTGGAPGAVGQSVVINSGAFAGTVTFDVSNNSINGAIDTPINVNKGGGTGTFSGRIKNNTIGTTGVANSGTTGNKDAIRAVTNGAGSYTAEISGNTIRQVSGNGIFAIARDGVGGDLDLTITGNTLSEPNPGVNAIRVESGATGTDDLDVCADIGGATAALRNTVNGDWGAVIAADEMRMRHQFSALCTFRMPGLSGGTTTDVVNHLTGRNSGFPPATASATIAGGGSYGGGAACVQPSN